MRKINYPLIVSDFDGTLVKADGTIDERNKALIAEYIAAGGSFAISTGRLPVGILPRVKELGLKGLVCCCQGAIILDIESGKTILDGKLSLETTLAIVRKMEKMGLHIHIYDQWDYYSNVDDEALKLYEQAVRVKAKLVTDKPLSQFIEERGFCSYKLLAVVHPKDKERVMKELAAEHFSGCEVTSSGEFLVEVVNARYSKGTAVEFLANYCNVPLAKTVAIGDQLNDLPMIERAGLGVAVQNAEQKLKDRADYVCTRTNEEGAVGKIIEKFGFIE